MAKDLVRTRRYIKKFIMMKANIQAVSLKVQTLKSQDAMAQVDKLLILYYLQKMDLWKISIVQVDRLMVYEFWHELFF